MKKEDHIEYWLKSSYHDLDSAESIFKIGRYDWCLFIAHLSLEKILKAIYIEKMTPTTCLREFTILSDSPSWRKFILMMILKFFWIPSTISTFRHGIPITS